MSRRHLLMLLALSALWGASFMLIKVGVRDFSPAALVWLRLTVAGVALGTGVVQPRRRGSLRR